MQKYFRTRENRNFSTVKSTEQRIFNFSLVEVLMMVGMAALQVLVVRFFFQGARKGKWLKRSGGSTSANNARLCVNNIFDIDRRMRHDSHENQWSLADLILTLALSRCTKTCSRASYGTRRCHSHWQVNSIIWWNASTLKYTSGQSGSDGQPQTPSPHHEPSPAYPTPSGSRAGLRQNRHTEDDR